MHVASWVHYAEAEDIVQDSTSMDSIWRYLQEHYNITTKGSSFLNIYYKLGGASPISPAVASMIRTLPLAAALPTLSLSLLGLQSRSWFLILSSVSFGIVLGPPPGFHRGSSLLRRCDLDLLL